MKAPKRHFHDKRKAWALCNVAAVFASLTSNPAEVTCAICLKLLKVRERQVTAAAAAHDE